jgi:germination protein YpeB
MDQPIMRKRGIYSVIVAILVVGVTTFASLIYIDRMQLGNRLQGSYQRELYDLIGNVHNLETDLSKVSISSSRQYAALLLADIWRQSGGAADRVNSLPITHASISETSKFLSQVSDFSYSLAKAQNDGGRFTSQELDSIDALKRNAAYLGLKLSELQRDMEDGVIGWSEIRYDGSTTLGQAQPNLIDQQFTDIDKMMQDHPSLIYDGPFSENILSIKPRVLSEAQVSMESAKQTVRKILGRYGIKDISLYSSKSDGVIPSYPFRITLNNSSDYIDMDISKNGGHLVFMLYNRATGSQTVDIKNAIDIGIKFLEDNGFRDMIPSFSQKSDGTLTVNYIYSQSSGKNNVVIYPDHVKVKVALDNGEVIGVEAEKYLTAHTSRNLQKPAISADTARSKASSKINITNTRLAVIPMLSKREVLCYEFVGRKDNTTYIIYINALDGREENILQIIDTPEGQLAM